MWGSAYGNINVLLANKRRAQTEKLRAQSNTKATNTEQKNALTTEAGSATSVNSPLASDNPVSFTSFDDFLIVNDPINDIFTDPTKRQLFIDNPYDILLEARTRDEATLKKLFELLCDQKTEIQLAGQITRLPCFSVSKARSLLEWIIAQKSELLLTIFLTIPGTLKMVSLVDLKSAVEKGHQPNIRQLLNISAIQQALLQAPKELLSAAENQDANIIRTLLAFIIEQHVNKRALPQDKKAASFLLFTPLDCLLRWMIEHNYVNLLRFFLLFEDIQEIIGNEMLSIQLTVENSTLNTNLILYHANDTSVEITQLLAQTAYNVILRTGSQRSAKQAEQCTALITWMLQHQLFHLLQAFVGFREIQKALTIDRLLKLIELEQKELVYKLLQSEEIRLVMALLLHRIPTTSQSSVSQWTLQELTDETFIYEMLNIIISRIGIIEKARLMIKSDKPAAVPTYPMLISWMLVNQYYRFIKAFLASGRADKIATADLAAITATHDAELMALFLPRLEIMKLSNYVEFLREFMSLADAQKYITEEYLSTVIDLKAHEEFAIQDTLKVAQAQSTAAQEAQIWLERKRKSRALHVQPTIMDRAKDLANRAVSQANSVKAEASHIQKASQARVIEIETQAAAIMQELLTFNEAVKKISPEHLLSIINSQQIAMLEIVLKIPHIAQTVLSAEHITAAIDTKHTRLLAKMVAIPTAAEKVNVSHIERLIKQKRGEEIDAQNDREMLQVLVAIRSIADKVTSEHLAISTYDYTLFALLYNASAHHLGLADLGVSPKPILPLRGIHQQSSITQPAELKFHELHISQTKDPSKRYAH